MRVAQEQGLQLSQNYNRVAPRLAAQIGRYAHAKQFKRMKKALRTLRTRLGRVHREVLHHLHTLPEAARLKVQGFLNRTCRILSQRMNDKNKRFTLHAPEVEWISNSKARPPYVFGVKVSIATTLREGLVVGTCAPRQATPTTATRGAKQWSKWQSSPAPTSHRPQPSWTGLSRREGKGRAHSGFRAKAGYHPNAQGLDQKA